MQQYRWVAFCYRQLCCRSNADSRNVHRQYTFHSATNYKETDYHTHRLARQNFYPDLGSGTNCRDERVYLFVSLSASISQKLHVQSSPIFYTLPAAVARSSTGGVAICYVLPVIRRRCEKTHTQCNSTAAHGFDTAAITKSEPSALKLT